MNRKSSMHVQSTRERSPITVIASELTFDARHIRLLALSTSLERCAAGRLVFGVIFRVTGLMLVAMLLFLSILVVQIVFRIVFSELAFFTLVAGFVYILLGVRVNRCLQAALRADEPAAAGCVASALSWPYMPDKREALVALTQLIARIGNSDWELMTRDDVAAIIACAADNNAHWAKRVGLAAVRSAVQHGELRAIEPLRQQIRAAERRHEGSSRVCPELVDLLASLEAQAAHLQSTNTLLRPADGSANLLRAAADAQATADLQILVRPADSTSTELPNLDKST